MRESNPSSKLNSDEIEVQSDTLKPVRTSCKN